ncbi:MAG: RsmD family RNA methyltransferase [Pirellulaceae bacterium]|nr:RsmD family RNA methyltransferase [Pirellulaceae bacterium]
MTNHPTDRNSLHAHRSSSPNLPKLRIVGGEFRGRTIEYSGDPRTRPMKDSIRESLFNLVGGFVPGRCAFDLFAGTGAVGIEALSRGATRALFIERHFPTAKIIRQNLRSLAENLPATVETADTFFWARQFFKNPPLWPTEPWLVFCCPPYSLYRSRGSELMEMLKSFLEHAPDGSVVVAETPEDFDVSLLPNPESSRIKPYSPALLCVWRPPSYENTESFDATGQ